MLHALTPLHPGTPTPHILHLVLWCLWLQSRRHCLITRLWNPGVWYSRFPGTVTIEETVLGRLLLPRHSMESRVEHIPSLSEKSTYQSQSSSLRGRSQEWHIPRDYIAALRECRSGDTTFVFFCLSTSSVPRRKKPVHFSEVPLSATASQGRLLITWPWEPAGLTFVVSQDLYTGGGSPRIPRIPQDLHTLTAVA